MMDTTPQHEDLEELDEVQNPLDTVLHGDCLVWLPKLKKESARLVIADPPYFNVLRDQDWDTEWRIEADYLEWTAAWIGAAMQVLVPGGLLYCFGQVGKRQHAMLHLMSQAARRCHFHDLLIWDRVVGYAERCDSWTPSYEMALVLRKDGAPAYFDKDAVREKYDKKTIAQYSRDKRYKDPDARRKHLGRGKCATNLWRIPSLKGKSAEKVGHPSQKPLELIERIVQACTMEGDLVVDPFLGSGTTAAAAQKHNRHWIGIEQDAAYVEIARARLGLQTASVNG